MCITLSLYNKSLRKDESWSFSVGWLVAAIIIALFSAIFTNLFLYRLTPERVTNFAIDKTLEMPIMNDEARRQVEAGRADAIKANKDPILKTGQAVTVFGWNVVRYTVYAAIFLVFARRVRRSGCAVRRDSGCCRWTNSS